ncbi:MAG: glutathione S-transferase family protein [Proteobacteria bacterium]|nr:glutathione S-transferase family protein [Pseudomonadota bacterium]
MSGPSLTLYNSVRSTCSLRVRLVLAAKRLPWTDLRVRLDRNEHLSEAFRRINPDALVPVLLADGQVVTESSVINEFLDEVFPEVPLRPADPVSRARMRTWVHYFDEVTMPALRYLSFQHFYLDVLKAVPAHERAAFAATLPLRKEFWLEATDAGFSPERIAAEHGRVDQTLQRLESTLAQTAWLVGDAPSLADMAVIPCIVRLEDMRLAHLWADRPAVAHWYVRARAQPWFDTAYYAGARFSSPDSLE